MILMTLILCSCFEQPDCLINNTNSLKIALKGKTLGKDTTFAFISIRSIDMNDTLDIQKPAQPIGAVQIPLPLNNTVATIIFAYNRNSKLVTDTLVVTYRNETRVISPDCGAYLYQHDVEVTKTNFEKVRVTTSILLTTVTKNLEIFL